jgi:hypothetical protein
VRGVCGLTIGQLKAERPSSLSLRSSSSTNPIQVGQTLSSLCDDRPGTASSDSRSLSCGAVTGLGLRRWRCRTADIGNDRLDLVHRFAPCAAPTLGLTGPDSRKIRASRGCVAPRPCAAPLLCWPGRWELGRPTSSPHDRCQAGRLSLWCQWASGGPLRA